jgi:hypothetical protein
MQMIGGQQQGMEQAQLDEMIQRFYTQQDLPLLQSQQLMALIQGMPGATGVSTVRGAQPQTSGLQQAIGLGMTMLPMLMGAPPIPGMGMGMMGK